MMKILFNIHMIHKKFRDVMYLGTIVSAPMIHKGLKTTFF